MAGEEEIDPSLEIVVTATRFNPNTDYCGSSGSGWVPDMFRGASIGEACYVHDLNYSSGSTISRIEADFQFAMDIFTILTNAGINPVEAAAVAGIYFEGVRGGGIFAYRGQGIPL